MSGLRPPEEELITFHSRLTTCQISVKIHKTLRLTQGPADNEHPPAVLFSLFIYLFESDILPSLQEVTGGAGGSLCFFF